MGWVPRLSRALGALGVAMLTVPAAAAAAPEFRFGVTAGEVKSSSAKVWASVTEAATLDAQVATDSGFANIVAEKAVAATPEHDFTAQTKVSGLKPGKRYRYRFCVEGTDTCSDVGRFQTAPKPGDAATVRFAYTGDTDAATAVGESDPFFGPFDVFESMLAEDNAFNIHIGDTIYSDSEVPGLPPALTLEQKWDKYKLNLGQAPLVALRGATGFYSQWDDHEFINDFSIPENGQDLYDAGVAAFRDYAPVGYTPEDGLYRTFRWGKNLELFFLDERSFRSAKASATGVCDNPDTDSPDLAPTAPQAIRNVFAQLIPSLVNPVSQECKDEINDPQRTLLGKPQLKEFLADLKGSKATWKVIMNETPIQQFYGLPYDRWEGYAYERIKLLQALQKKKIKHVVFLTTDTHADFANVIRLRTLPNDVAPTNAPSGPKDTPYRDFIAGPVATGTFWREIDGVTGTEGSGELLSTMFFKPVLGMFCAQGDQDSYAEVTASSKKFKVAYKASDGGPVTDVDDTKCGPYTLKR